jgi:hypothetical protein
MGLVVGSRLPVSLNTPVLNQRVWADLMIFLIFDLEIQLSETLQVSRA